MGVNIAPSPTGSCSANVEVPGNSSQQMLNPVAWRVDRDAIYHTIYLMNATATVLYRSPERVFSAADRGEEVTIRRGKSEYVLTRKAEPGRLYGCLRGTIRRDTGKPKVHWKAAR
jgi:hypothetical protein